MAPTPPSSQPPAQRWAKFDGTDSTEQHSDSNLEGLDEGEIDLYQIVPSYALQVEGESRIPSGFKQ